MCSNIFSTNHHSNILFYIVNDVLQYSRFPSTCPNSARVTYKNKTNTIGKHGVDSLFFLRLDPEIEQASRGLQVTFQDLASLNRCNVLQFDLLTIVYFCIFQIWQSKSDRMYYQILVLGQAGTHNLFIFGKQLNHLAWECCKIVAYPRFWSRNSSGYVLHNLLEWLIFFKSDWSVILWM